MLRARPPVPTGLFGSMGKWFVFVYLLMTSVAEVGVYRASVNTPTPLAEPTFVAFPLVFHLRDALSPFSPFFSLECAHPSHFFLSHVN